MDIAMSLGVRESLIRRIYKRYLKFRETLAKTLEGAGERRGQHWQDEEISDHRD